MKQRVTLNSLRAVRAKARDSLHALPNVIGTALGEKLTSGTLTKERSVIIYVSEKKPRVALKNGLVPKTIITGQQKLSTDVVEIHTLRQQFGPPPYFCRDGARVGSVTAMCRFDAQVFAATCAHNLKGPDLDIYTRDRMELYHPYLNKWIEVGDTNFVQYARGYGLRGNYGFIDAGLFTIEDDNLATRCRVANELRCWDRVRTGIKVWALASKRRTLRGVIVHVEEDFGQLYADACIMVDPPGTYDGDSGVLWRTDSGIAAVVHARGSGDYGDGGTQFSFGMFAHRVEAALGVKFVDLPA
jgi:hypothetical protein